MKRILTVAVIAVFAVIATGCHGQLPVTQHTVTLTVTSNIPAGSTFVASKAVLSAGTPSCPAPTGSNYTPINASSPSTTGTFVDVTSAGQTVCEVMQLLSGGATSPASKTVGPYVVPANPTAPTISGQTAMNQPENKNQQLAQHQQYEMPKSSGNIVQPQLVAKVQ